jgi:hypothetical protein
MKVVRLVVPLLLLGITCGALVPEGATAQIFRPPGPGGRRVSAPRRPSVVVRAPVVIHRDWPLKRPPRPVVVIPPRVERRTRVAPRVFLPPILFGAAVLSLERERWRRDRDYYRDRDHEDHRYSRESLVWQDDETLYREDDWTEFTFDSNTRGTKLWFEILKGRAQIDWAEVVFENGEVQVVEFPERSLDTGLYRLLDFRDGRRVDYVRIVARAVSRETNISLWMER